MFNFLDYYCITMKQQNKVMGVQQQKQDKVQRGFTPRIDEDLRLLVLKIQAKRILEEEKTISINQVVSDLIRSGAKSAYPDLVK